MNYFSTGFYFIKRYLKKSRNRAVTRARQKPCTEKYSLEKERKETENILL